MYIYIYINVYMYILLLYIVLHIVFYGLQTDSPVLCVSYALADEVLSDDMADDLRTHLKLWGTKRAFGISIRRFVKTQPSNAMIEALFHVRKQHDQCFQQRRISVSCKSET